MAPASPQGARHRLRLAERPVLVAPDSFKGTFRASEVAGGLALVAEEERDAWAASTYGTGELIAAAVAAGARVVLVAAGGSATTDGGAGALEAIEAGGGLRGAKLVILCDVTVPWERAPAV